MYIDLEINDCSKRDNTVERNGSGENKCNCDVNIRLQDLKDKYADLENSIKRLWEYMFNVEWIQTDELKSVVSGELAPNELHARKEDRPEWPPRPRALIRQNHNRKDTASGHSGKPKWRRRTGSNGAKTTKFRRGWPQFVVAKWIALW